MMRRVPILVAAMLLLGGLQDAGGRGQPAAKPFGLANVHFEQNATDGDVEVVFEATGDRNGLVQLTVVAPDGRAVVDFEAPKGSMGLRQFRMESPEPPQAAAVKAAYPEGVYRFSGTTSQGASLRGEGTLSHRLPAPVSIVRPPAEGASVEKLEIAWTPVKGVAAYLVSIEQEETNVSVTGRLPATATRFLVPEGFARPGTEYKVAVGAWMANGNASFVETTITTAAASAKK